MIKSLNELCRFYHEASSRAGWWTGYDRTNPKDLAVKIALIHSEVSECLEGLRKDKMDDHLPHRKSGEVELADVLIRVFDLAGALGYDLDGAVTEKGAYNLRRVDHQPTTRTAWGGKAF